MSRNGGTAFPCENESHEAIASWFLGPKAENHEFMRMAFNFIVDDLHKARREYKPEDGEFITKEVQTSRGFQNSMLRLKDLLVKLSGYMAEHNIPFYSPRYNAHMNSDTSLPGTLGYLLTMLYNPNNVAPEASPLTSLMEYEVGQDLCDMLGYARQPVNGPRDSTMDPNSDPLGWGHITCDGSVANLESMWVARNLKFYPLTLKNAMAKGAPFHSIASKLKVPLCTGETKLFDECTTWELLNLTADAVLDLGPRIVLEFGLSNDYVQKVMGDYIIQTTSKDAIQAQYGLGDAPPQYFIATTKHYSWPKGAAITGIGSTNLIELHIDNHARMDPHHLEELLEGCLERQQAVYAVVCIIGSTEHGAVDPIADVIRLREEFQKRGLSFLVHADAAWGGYFTSLLSEVPERSRDGTTPIDPYVPKMTLLPHTKTQLEHIKYADSITIDPHKSGYIPYPAGALCYRDERMRFLVTWTSPYIDFQSEGVQTMGTYGLEGSKPGAAPVAAWLSHEVIGLHKGGYGALLGEAMFTGVKMYSHWATMTTETSPLIVTPFNMLPIELDVHATQQDVENQKEFIRQHIVNRPNRELVADKEAMELVQLLGGDLLLNAFSCNFRINGVTNTSVTEANAFNSRIYEALSVLQVADDIEKRDVFVMSSVFSQAKYGECLTNFKRRLGLEGDEDLFVLGNASMSPFPTAGNFIAEVIDAFKVAAEKVIREVCIPRNTISPATHTFIMQGTDKVYLVYLPLFQMATYRQQLILAVDLPRPAMQAYVAAKQRNPEAVFILHTSQPELLSDILKQKSFRALIDNDLPESHRSLIDPNTRHFLSNVQVSNIRVVKNRSLDPRLLEPTYPEQMPFYLYGTTKQQHIDHILLSSPNAQLSAENVTFSFDKDQHLYGPGIERELEQGLIAVFDDVNEAGMQPFTRAHEPTFFEHGQSYRVTIHRDSVKGVTTGINSSVFARGTVTFTSKKTAIFTDYEMINQDLTKVPEFGKNDPSKVAALNDFVRGSTTAKEVLVQAGVDNVTSHGNCIVLDRFHQHNRHTDHTRTVAQRSAWKASWETAVGRSS